MGGRRNGRHPDRFFIGENYERDSIGPLGRAEEEKNDSIRNPLRVEFQERESIWLL
jgi:hypothetical protein